jgi:hypothetical protein
VTLNDIRYDLPLPAQVADALLAILGRDGPFRRLDRYCDSLGIDRLRSNPSILQSDPYPSYAEGELRFTVTDRHHPMGYCLQQAVANQAAAQEIVRFGIEAGLEEDVMQWIMTFSPFLIESGGFEIVRAWHYFSAKERDTVYAQLDGAVVTHDPKLLGENPRGRKMLRDLMQLADR